MLSLRPGASSTSFVRTIVKSLVLGSLLLSLVVSLGCRRKSGAFVIALGDNIRTNLALAAWAGVITGIIPLIARPILGFSSVGFANLDAGVFLGSLFGVVLLPPVSLHFYLAFPRPKPFFVRRPWTTLLALYGPPVLFLALAAHMRGATVTGEIVDSDGGRLIPARLHIAAEE